MQSANAAEMMSLIAQTIAVSTSVLAVEPGDVIATRTPAGVGQHRIPPVFRMATDQVEVQISSGGIALTPVVAAPKRLEVDRL